MDNRYSIPSTRIVVDQTIKTPESRIASAAAFCDHLVAPNQLFSEGGYIMIPCLALLLNDQNFVKWIHRRGPFISATGEPKAGEKLVFRAAYGKLRKDRKLTRSCSLSRQSSHISVQGVKVVTN